MTWFRRQPLCNSITPGSASWQRGVTLIELLVTLGILTVLLTLAVPSFSDFIIGNRIVSNTNDFMTTLNLARSEAIKRGTYVSVCRSSDSSTCASDSANDKNWSSGWIVFVDADKSGTYNSASDTEELLRIHGALDTNYTLISNASSFARYVTFDHLGAVTNAGAAGTSFMLCANNTTNLGRSITVTRTKLRANNTAASCS